MKNLLLLIACVALLISCEKEESVILNNYCIIIKNESCDFIKIVNINDSVRNKLLLYNQNDTFMIQVDSLNICYKRSGESLSGTPSIFNFNCKLISDTTVIIANNFNLSI